MIKNLPKENLLKIVEFIQDNYEAPEFLIPKSVSDLIEDHGKSHIIIVKDDYGIEALSLIKLITPYLAEKYRTVVRLDSRGRGISKKIDELAENFLRNQGITKIKTNIYTNNFPSLFGRLKRGYVIEGLLRNHDEQGRHEYVLGKELE